MSDRSQRPASSKPLSVRCPDCDAQFKLRNRDLIGRRMPCPECGFRFTIRPETGETVAELEPEWIEDDQAWDADVANLHNFDDMEELPAAQTAEPPKSQRPRRQRDADDREIFEVEPYRDDMEDELPGRADRSRQHRSRGHARPAPHRSQNRRSRSSSGSAKKWAALAGGLLLTIAVVLLAVLLIKNTSSSSTAGQNRLAYLPADCRAVGFFRVGDLSRSPYFQTQLAGAPQLRGVVDQFRDRTGMDLSDLESVVMGIYEDDPAEFNSMSVLLHVPRNTPFVMVARANKDWDRTRLIGENTTSATHAGETYHLLSSENRAGGNWGLYLPDARTLVLGTASEVKAAIDTRGQAPDWVDVEFVQPEYHVVTARVSQPGRENVGPSPPHEGIPIGMHPTTAGRGLQLDGDGIKPVTFLKFSSSGEAAQYIRVLNEAQQQVPQMPIPQPQPAGGDAFGLTTFRQFGRTVAVAQGGLGDLAGMVGGTTAFAPLPFLACLGSPPAANPTTPIGPNPQPHPPIAQQPQPEPRPGPRLVPENPPPPVPVVKNANPPRQNPPTPPMLEAPPDARTLDALLADLQETKGFKAKNAARRLAKVQPDPGRQKEAARLLENLTTNGSHFEKQAAADALGVWGDAETVPFLLAKLDDQINKDVFLKKRVLVALGKLKDPQALVPMIQQIKNIQVRREAVQGLKFFGAAAEPELLKALAATERQTQQAICDILKDIGTARSLPALDALAGGGNSFVQSHAQTAAAAIRNGGP